jgi:hypothetical protein
LGEGQTGTLTPEILAGGPPNYQIISEYINSFYSLYNDNIIIQITIFILLPYAFVKLTRQVTIFILRLV